MPSAAFKRDETAAALNNDFEDYLFIVCACLIVALACWRVGIETVKYIRLVTCLNNEKQTYFAIPSQKWASFKKHLLYAPLLGRRHNREFQLSAAISVGSLPTRFQTLFILAYLGTNVAFCVVSIDWRESYPTVAAELRNRTGILAVVNMIPMFVMAVKNNPLIKWLNLSYDSFNLLHRWFGRIVVLEVIAHTSSWMAKTVHTEGWPDVWAEIKGEEPIMYGFIATVAMVTIAIFSSSLFRHAFYELFKLSHWALAILTIIALWYHLKLFRLPQLDLVYVLIAIWVAENAYRIAVMVYRNVGRGGTKTLVEALPGNAVRVTMDLARPWTFKPGQHAYLYLPSIQFWTSHPFSVAWSDDTDDTETEKLAMTRQDVLAMQKTRISFIIRARTGMTDKLYKMAETAPDGRFYTKCFADGPYGGMHMMHSYGTVMLFAGGVGITHQVPHVRDLVAGYANGSVAARKIILVWVIKSPEHLEWIRPWMTSILAMDKRRDVLRIMLFVSRPRSTKEIHSPSATILMFPGRPNIDVLIEKEMVNQVGAMGVSVCGGGDLSDDVRRAVRAKQHAGNIDFVEEAFSW